jgi:hypothetical protein
MSTKTTIEHAADDKSAGLTFQELGEFVQEAERAGIPLEAPVKVVSGLRSQIKSIGVTG